MFVPIVTLLELWLALGDESDHLNCCSPGVLNKSAILDLQVQASQTLPNFRIDVVLVYIVDAAIPRPLRMLDVVIFINIIPPLMIEPCLVEFIAEGDQFGSVLENQTATSDVVHTRQLHPRKSIQLVDNRALALMSLRNGDTRIPRPETQNRLKGIQYGAMCRPPFFDDVQILRSGTASTYVFAGTIDPRLRASGKFYPLLLWHIRTCCWPPNVVRPTPSRAGRKPAAPRHLRQARINTRQPRERSPAAAAILVQWPNWLFSGRISGQQHGWST